MNFKYFALNEFFKTNTGLDNYPYNIELRQNLYELITFMDELREDWTIYCNDNNLGTGAINSGYRNINVNRLVGGSPTSVHPLGFACDFVPVNKHMSKFQNFVINWIKDKQFDQLIIEEPINGVASWLHIGLYSKNGKQRKQIFELD